MYSGRIFLNHIDEIMIRANETEPRYAECTERGSDQTMRGAVCVAAMGYLTDVYPLEGDGRYPYLIKFSLPIWALPQSTEAGLAVSKFVSQFIVSQDGNTSRLTARLRTIDCQGVPSVSASSTSVSTK